MEPQVARTLYRGLLRASNRLSRTAERLYPICGDDTITSMPAPVTRCSAGLANLRASVQEWRRDLGISLPRSDGNGSLLDAPQVHVKAMIRHAFRVEGVGVGVRGQVEDPLLQSLRALRAIGLACRKLDDSRRLQLFAQESCVSEAFSILEVEEGVDTASAAFSKDDYPTADIINRPLCEYGLCLLSSMGNNGVTATLAHGQSDRVWVNTMVAVLWLTVAQRQTSQVSAC